MTSVFDATASSFEHYRLLPGGVPEAIRSAICNAVHPQGPAQVLDIGAGTGRIGRAFVTAGDFYVGVDPSLAMLREFSANSIKSLLVQADGSQLPFRDGTFDVVLLMHVLSAVKDWQKMLNEARRVLRLGGSLAVGHTAGPESGIEAQLKRQLRAILEEMQVEWPRPRERGRQALAWLEYSASLHMHLQAASWTVNFTAQDFLQRQRTGARFVALPLAVQEQALGKLRAWAETNIGPIEACFEQKHSFELDIFRIPGKQR